MFSFPPINRTMPNHRPKAIQIPHLLNPDIMKSLILFAAILFALSAISNAQSVGINSDGSTPNASAMLDVKSSTKGFLVPRLTAAQKTAISSPATGLMIYQTDASAGFYYYNGSSWAAITNLAYGCFYNIATSAKKTIDNGASFLLSNNGIMSGMTHTTGLPGITVTNAGIYKIDYLVNVTSGVGGRLLLLKGNFIEVHESLTTILNPGIVSGSVIISLSAGDNIELVNDGTSVVLSEDPDVSIKITITQLK